MTESKKSDKVSNNSKKVSSNSMIISVVVAVLIGWVFGYVVGSAADVNNQEQAVAKIDEETGNTEVKHEHNDTIEANVQAPPTVDLVITRDSSSGYNLKLITTNFEFDPGGAGLEHVDGKGHAHVYVNGEKVGRIYGQWYHLAGLDDGENEIKVTLNSNDHSDYTLNGEKIQATVTVNNDGHTDHTHVDNEHDSMNDSSGHQHN